MAELWEGPMICYTPPPLPLVSCPSGKKPHFTARAACGHLRRLVCAEHAGRGRMDVYLCLLCDRWHVGHAPDAAP